jgi:hypothetical protein
MAPILFRIFLHLHNRGVFNKASTFTLAAAATVAVASALAAIKIGDPAPPPGSMAPRLLLFFVRLHNGGVFNKTVIFALAAAATLATASALATITIGEREICILINLREKKCNSRVLINESPFH